ncbi:O-antigen ligase family protein [Agriterribacter sp.]|uniref:O-antigen ligase family protein n=1 Tax=Agriterribacter sp. TaxID=2821509 RepID=UPI002CEA288C|nr:O-antigen ligase family protein [Agriterribacter sp.]HTN08891.1 O-antigen ligase family protein [Agriterribacter sp.]
MLTTDNIYRYSLLGVAFLLPSPFYGGVLFFLSIAGVCWITQKNHRQLPGSLYKNQVLLPALLYLYIVAGFFFSENFRVALSTLSTMLPFILFPVFIGTSPLINRKLLRKINISFLISITATLLFAVVYNIINIAATGISSVMLFDGYYHKLHSFGLTNIYYNWHPTYGAAFANLGIAILFHLYFTPKNSHTRSQKILMLCTALFLSTSIFLLDSLVGIGAYFILLLFLFIKQRKHRGYFNTTFKKILALSVLLIGIAILYINPFENAKIDSLKNKPILITDVQSERNLFTIRLAKWSVYYDIFTSEPFFGTTLGDIADIRKENYTKRGFDYLALHNYNAHNQYMEILAALGVVGLSVFLMLLFSPLGWSGVNALYFPFFIICLITFCTESVLHRQQGILFFMFFYSLYTHFNLRKNSS